MAEEIKVGSRCEVQGNRGVVRFHGTTAFAAGVWVGVELDEPVGKNDGSVKDQRYFTTQPNHGIFVRPSAVTVLKEEAKAVPAAAPAEAPAAVPAAAPSQPQAEPEPEPVAATPAPTRVAPAAVLGSDAPIVPQTPLRAPLEEPAALSMTASPAQPMVPQKKYDDLVRKFQVLESKRAEDREKLKEYERLQHELAAYKEHKTKLTAQVAELQQALRDIRKEYADYKTETEEALAANSELAENIEHLTLDKEMADARAEELELQVAELQERVEELTMDLEILRSERSEDGSGGGASIAELEQMKEQNNRLKEALIRLRDTAAEEKADFTKRLKETEKLAKEHPDLLARCERYKKELADNEELIENLRMQLEDAHSAQSLVEELTEKVMNLEDRIIEQQSTIEDLEALRALNEELEESHVENEKQLQAELEYKDAIISAHTKSVERLQESIGDYEQTIQKFRELVRSLQADIENLREKQAESTSEALASQTQTMETIKLELQSSTMKAQAKSIALDLRRLEGEQAAEQLQYIRAYLPESFFKKEIDPMRFLLLIRRLQFKTDLVVQNIAQMYRIEASKRGIVSVFDEELSHSCQLRAHFTTFSGLLHRIWAFAQYADVTEYMKLGASVNEFSAIEKRLDAFIELVREEEISPATPLVDIQRAIAAAEQFVATYMSNDSAAVQIAAGGVLRALPTLIDISADEAFVVLRKLHNTVVTAVREKSEVDLTDLVNLIAGMNKFNKSAQVLSRKLARRIEELASAGKRLEHAQFAQSLQALLDTYGTIKRDVARLAGVFATALTAEEVTEDAVASLVAEATASSEAFKALSASLAQLVDQALIDSNVVALPTTPTALQTRAQTVRADYNMNEGLRSQIDALQADLAERAREIKLRDQRIAEADAKIELVEKRMETARRFNEKAAEYEAQIDKLKKNETKFVEAIESLQQDNDKLEKELQDLRKKRGTTSAALGSSVGVGGADIAEVNNLRKVVAMLRNDNAELRERLFNLETLRLEPLRPRPTPSESVDDVALQLNTLLRTAESQIASRRVVQLVDRSARAALSLKELERFEQQEQQLALLERQREALLAAMATKPRPSAVPAAQAKSAAAANAKRLGRLCLPASMVAGQRGTQKVVVDDAQFRELHGVFVA